MASRLAKAAPKAAASRTAAAVCTRGGIASRSEAGPSSDPASSRRQKPTDPSAVAASPSSPPATPTTPEDKFSTQEQAIRAAAPKIRGGGARNASPPARPSQIAASAPTDPP
eukprot:CAMPEP_0203927354 /NCGR_PEP_ID=MMETSP0359-20131031/66777_1 /ASSEMBLY_ACC=CAM_ASM_000338 /TAXON_ID=268821 /ORGANISM="Scrippsiella Hangoei, Strain SHTV-5" /LENGTH=111 /DNA_ID=CAMNT_0050856095 /DNA_START=52 /DNA_END=383 /DNA_ORIENTATION=+